LHISTDFVFGGYGSSQPYAPDAPTAPEGVYARTKLDGERAVIAACPDNLVVRTAWVHAPKGSNFVTTMLRLMGERETVGVVSDQISTPTGARSLAQALWGLAHCQAEGIQHFTDAGVASWYDFACAIQEEAAALGMLEGTVRIVPIATDEYPTPARRPAYSLLDKSRTWELLGGPAPHWRTTLRETLQDIKNG
ncbi:MAG: dTDP-4-dehydrorhamnose reductase, partial [Hyphomicrobiales bacterium]